jgi:predicted nucleotidyltransferase
MPLHDVRATSLRELVELAAKVDVGTPASLRERLQDEVLAEAVPL